MIFIGRFHPLLVHFPIALLLLAAAFEFLARRDRYRGLESSILPILLIGAISAVLSSITGFILSNEGGYEAGPLNRHEWFGIITATISVVTLMIKWRLPARKGILQSVLIVLIVGVIITGHLGANLTHGEDFLTEYAPWNRHEEKPFAWPEIQNIDSAILYADVIQPMLEHRCYKCHSSSKQKGELRLDQEQYILKGGKHGSLLAKEKGELVKRITLPIEAEHHMPPDEQEQLSSSEIELLIAWVDDGADFRATVALMQDADRVRTDWAALQSVGKDDWVPSGPVAAGDHDAIEALKAAGASVMPVAQNQNYLTIDLINNEPTTQTGRAMGLLSRQIVELDLSGSTLSDSLLLMIGHLTSLRRLNLAHAVGSFSVMSMASVLSLPELRSLNMVGASMGDSLLTEMGRMMNLRSLYVYKASVSGHAIANLSMARPDLLVDTGGYQLVKLITDTLVYKQGVVYREPAGK